MPFDVLVNHPYTLADTLDRLGIRPVPMERLVSHKQEQVRLHPASWPYRRTSWYLLFIANAIGFGLLNWDWSSALNVTVLVVLVSGLALSATLMTIFVVMHMYVACGIPLKQRAGWGEYNVRPCSNTWRSRSLPSSIRTMARMIAEICPTAEFTVGELVQRNVLLDPYLIVKFNDEQACLGIWDFDEGGNEKIIVAAEID